MSEDWRTRESPVWSNDQLAAWRIEVWEALQPEPFRAWLSQFPGDRVIVHAYQTDGCPIANYLRDILPHLDCEVGENHVSCDMPQLFKGLNNFGSGPQDLHYLGGITLNRPGGREMPTWVKPFIQAMDNLFMRATKDYKLWETGKSDFLLHQHPWPVKAAGAIAVLDEILATLPN